MNNENRRNHAESWIGEQAEAAKPPEEQKKAQMRIDADFREGSKILVYVPLGDISQKIQECRGIQKDREIKFSIEQILLDEELIAKAGIEWEERTYTLKEDLSEKRKDPSFQRAISIPIRATDDKTGEDIEAKIMPPFRKKTTSEEDRLKAIKRFQQECFFFFILKNPYILPMRGIIAKRTPRRVIPFVGLATKYIQSAEGDSYTLSQLMETVNEFNVEEVVSIVQPIASALRTIHNEVWDDRNDLNRPSLVHRNINPSMIRILKNGELYIYDFGLAKLISEEEDVQMGGEKTAVGTVIGDIKYISREQAWTIESSKLRPPTDVYSLCVIAYELMIGRSPYTYSDPDELIEKVRSNDFTSIKDVADSEKWGLKVLDMIDSGMAQTPIHRLPEYIIKGKKYMRAARFEETMKEFAEQKPLPALLDEHGNYSEERAKEVRSNLVTAQSAWIQAYR